MVCKNDRSTFIAIQEYLSLHAVKAQFDNDVNRLIIFAGDLSDSIFYIQFIWQRWNIRRTTYGDWDTSDTTAFGKKVLWSSIFVTLVAKKYRLATMLPFVPRMVCDSR